MRWRLLPLAALLLFSGVAHAAPAQPAALPHFMSLKTEGANGRRGPSSDQPVLWIYQRVGLPLQITGESGSWRRVRDPDGVTVWMQLRNLDERRSVIVRGREDAPMRFEAEPKSHVKAYLAPGVVGYITGCSGPWRRIVVGSRAGWVSVEALWGADPACTESE
jgi:SH3-like domain-containing protein